MFGTRKLGRTSDQRKAMLRAMTTYLFEKARSKRRSIGQRKFSLSQRRW